MKAFPLLSEYDPALSAEGSLDPLGLYSIADALAVRLVPGVRQRQRHPRFLTTMSASFAICEDFGEEVVASDRISEPWQVFEWYVVEGLVRTLGSGQDLAARDDEVLVDPYPALTNNDRLHGLPGRNKAAKAIHEEVPLSAKRYLKTPSVFGFHGVYRTLARELNIEMAGRMGEAGYELLSVWQEEQGLTGFMGSVLGEGQRWRDLFRKAVEDGLKKGAVARTNGWQGWSFIRDHLSHTQPGPREAQLLANLLSGGNSGFRGQAAEFLSGEEGLEIWEATGSERAFHAALLKFASEGLGELLKAISAYESFSRLLQDAFDDCLFHLSLTRRKVGPQELSGLQSVVQASQKVPSLYPDVAERLSPWNLTARLENSFASLGQAMAPLDWAETLMEHHRRVQGRKPPQGKASWVDRFDDGGYMVRPLYLRDRGGLHADEYVHAYRTDPLFSFLRDLGKVNS
jgi:hypothetical protein